MVALSLVCLLSDLTKECEELKKVNSSIPVTTGGEGMLAEELQVVRSERDAAVNEGRSLHSSVAGLEREKQVSSVEGYSVLLPPVMRTPLYVVEPLYTPKMGIPLYTVELLYSNPLIREHLYIQRNLSIPTSRNEDTSVNSGTLLFQPPEMRTPVY